MDVRLGEGTLCTRGLHGSSSPPSTRRPRSTSFVAAAAPRLRSAGIPAAGARHHELRRPARARAHRGGRGLRPGLVRGQAAGPTAVGSSTARPAGTGGDRAPQRVGRARPDRPARRSSSCTGRWPRPPTRLLRHHGGQLHRLPRAGGPRPTGSRRVLLDPLRNSHFHFLGYRLGDWNLRVILSRIWGQQKLDLMSWSVQRGVDRPRRAGSGSSAGGDDRGGHVSDYTAAGWGTAVATSAAPCGARDLPRGRVGARRAARARRTGASSPTRRTTRRSSSAARPRSGSSPSTTCARRGSPCSTAPSGVGRLGAARRRRPSADALVDADSAVDAAAGRTAARGAAGPTAVTDFRSWRDPPLPALIERSAARPPTHSARGTYPRPSPAPRSSNARWTERVHSLLVILDQFEDYFPYHPEDAATAASRRRWRVVHEHRPARQRAHLPPRRRVARLDRFKGRVPGLYDNYLRVDHLDLAAAREAILGPGRDDRRLPRAGAGRRSRTGSSARARLRRTCGRRDGHDRRAVAPGRRRRRPGRVETAFLQLVMSRLWEAEAGPGLHALRTSTLRSLGGPRRSCRGTSTTRWTRCRRTSGGRGRVLQYLVTPSDTKIAHTAADLAGWSETPPAGGRPRSCERLCGRRPHPAGGRAAPGSRGGGPAPLRALPRRPRGRRARLEDALHGAREGGRARGGGAGPGRGRAAARAPGAARDPRGGGARRAHGPSRGARPERAGATRATSATRRARSPSRQPLP